MRTDCCLPIIAHLHFNLWCPISVVAALQSPRFAMMPLSGRVHDPLQKYTGSALGVNPPSPQNRPRSTMDNSMRRPHAHARPETLKPFTRTLALAAFTASTTFLEWHCRLQFACLQDRSAQSANLFLYRSSFQPVIVVNSTPWNAWKAILDQDYLDSETSQLLIKIRAVVLSIW